MPMAGQYTRSPFARASGLGPAKEGVEHWRRERVTAVALVPLTVWYVASIIAHNSSDYTEFVAWLKMPFTTCMMVLSHGAWSAGDHRGLRPFRCEDSGVGSHAPRLLRIARCRYSCRPSHHAWPLTSRPVPRRRSQPGAPTGRVFERSSSQCLHKRELQPRAPTDCCGCSGITRCSLRTGKAIIVAARWRNVTRVGQQLAPIHFGCYRLLKGS